MEVAEVEEEFVTHDWRSEVLEERILLLLKGSSKKIQMYVTQV